jgi:hypothetical protein
MQHRKHCADFIQSPNSTQANAIPWILTRALMNVLTHAIGRFYSERPNKAHLPEELLLSHCRAGLYSMRNPAAQMNQRI